MTQQRIFNPANYTFEWTDDGWYEWDSKKAHRQALKARNAEAKRMKQDGLQPRKYSMRDQLITKGGIGSGHPEISLVVNCYVVVG